jgi:acyl-CoA thioester hydrolase
VCGSRQISASLGGVPTLPPSAFTKRCAIRGRDMDAVSHPKSSVSCRFVNNAAYLTYLEETRDEWFLEVLGSGLLLSDFVLARCAIDYRQLLMRDDRHVDVEVRCTRVGTSSITMAERVSSARDGRLAAEAESVVVHLDPATGKSRPLTDEIRVAFNRWLL